jgi:hypothetical protein
MNINFKRLLILLIPTFLRKEVLKCYLNAISIVFQHNKNELDIFFKELNYHIRVTPQVFSLQKMLNDKFDPILRRILIDVPEAKPTFYFYDNENVSMRYFSNSEFFYRKTGFDYDFYVFVPLELADIDTENMIIELLNRYKLISKTFKIIYV